MEEKRYPPFEDEQGIDMACEPIAEVATPANMSVDGVTAVHDWTDDLDWDRFPSYGPFSEEEAVARIDEFEKQLAKGEVKWIRVDNLHAELKKLHPWL